MAPTRQPQRRRRVVPALAFAVLGALIVRVVLGALNFSTAVMRAAPSPPSEADTIPSYLWELHSSRERSPVAPRRHHAQAQPGIGSAGRRPQEEAAPSRRGT